MRLLLTFLFVIPAFLMRAQEVDLNKLSPNLWDQMVDHPEELAPVYILLEDQVDIQSMHRRFIAEKTPLHDRGVEVVTALKAKAAATQGPLLEFLRSQSVIDHHSIRPFWGTNVIEARVLPATIRALTMRRDVGKVELIIPAKLTTASEAVAAPSVPNGTEPGITQMNAHKLWQMGYSGAGTVVMTVDSGTEWIHPSLIGNYKGIYFLEDESYTGLGANGPTDCDGHGTRVTGNMCGLDRVTNDTIGPAFNALWIAGPNGTLIDACLDAQGGSTISTFQFALDPDDDSNTTTDMPTVINNSYGINAGCFNNTAEANIQTNLMAAGVGITWSAGNDGPNPSTTNSDGAINISLVNSFAIGAVDVNANIAGFSSRGPSQCAGTGAIDIKPEVVAMGVSVRSSDVNGGYSSQNGTSFSSPYVAGAIALLKEAFPDVSGEDISLALYLSATDLGAPGEDNDYGNGLINCEAAFNYLVGQGHTPANPIVERDAVMVTIDDSGQLCGDGTYSGVITFENNGTAPLTSLDIEVSYSKNEMLLTSQSYSWTGNVVQGERATFDIPAQSGFIGEVNVAVTLNNPNGAADQKPFNNRYEKPVLIFDFEAGNAITVGETVASPCGSSDIHMIASAENAIDAYWYTQQNGGSPITEGFVYTLSFNNPLNFYVDFLYDVTGGIANIEQGDIAYANNGGGLIFDVYQTTTIKSVDVYASGNTGVCFAQIRNHRGVQVEAVQVNLSEGVNTIEWDAVLEPGLNYAMIYNIGFSNLAETSGSDVQFPYQVGESVLINSSIGGATDKYQHFYNWKAEHTSLCGRFLHRFEPSGSSNGVQAGFEISGSLETNSPITFSNTGTAASSYYWDFGDGNTSIEESPLYTYAEPGTYLVTQTLVSDEGCGVSAYQYITVDVGVNTNEPEAGQYISVFPNPTNGSVNVDFDFETIQNVGVQLIDVTGKLLQQQPPVDYGRQSVNIDLTQYSSGVYYLLFQMDEGTVVRRVVKMQ